MLCTFIGIVGWWIWTVMLLVEGVNGGTEEEAQKWLEAAEAPHNEICSETVLKEFDAGTNITPENQKALEEQSKILAKYMADMQSEVLAKFPNWSEFKNNRLRRAFKYLAIGGVGNMSLDRVEKMNKMMSNMTIAYSVATVCEYNNASNCELQLQDVEGKLKSVKDTNELAYYWTAWHDAMSAAVSSEYYQEVVGLLTELANANGFNYYSETVLANYDEERDGWTFIDFERMLLRLAEDISGLYNILHAYVRMKLRKMPEYAGMIDECGYIPVHITGNMWSQEWSLLDEITKPFPDAPALDATAAMVEQGYTPLRMFQEADRFYQGMGLNAMTDEFWNNSVLEQPDDGRQMTCHAFAYDMCKGPGSKDFRIRQCTNVTQQDFVVVHHEMGHIQHFQEYTDLEFVFRTSANPGFHEAIGDAVALAVTTPKHLQCHLHLDLGFPITFCAPDEGPFNVTETDINFLYRMGLTKLVFLPFAASMDFWRWSAWEGKVSTQDLNKMWWQVRQDFQGISTPSDRTSYKLFDPAAKFHIVSNIDYIRYFIAGVVQFQFYEAMCIAAKEFDPDDPKSKPLYQCDFSGSTEAGKLIGHMMKMGFSEGWPNALEAMTGSRILSVKPIKDYLQPVLDYMEKELIDNGEIIGFGDSCEEVKNRSGTSKWSQLIPPEFWTAIEKI